METRTINPASNFGPADAQQNQLREQKINDSEINSSESNILTAEENFLKRIAKKLDKICARIIGA